MADSVTSLVVGGIGVAIGTLFQYAFRRYTETQQLRREIVETRLLQLQNSVESLYYRANNLLDWDGRDTMSDDYYRQTSTYIFATLLAHEALFASTGLYAKLHRDTELKSGIKGALHRLDSAMDADGFLHYHRVQLGDMATNADRVLTFTEFLDRWSDPRYQVALQSAQRAVQSITSDKSRLETIRGLSGQLVSQLSRKTGVPSALELTGRSSSRAPA